MSDVQRVSAECSATLVHCLACFLNEWEGDLAGYIKDFYMSTDDEAEADAKTLLRFMSQLDK